MTDSASGSPFAWPSVRGVTPLWTGHGFDVGGHQHAVLDFEAGDSGWSEELTRFHEQTAGEGSHPIDVASRRRARRALRRHLDAPPERTVLLEVGCSSGFLLPELVEDWPRGLVIGSDYLPGPLYALAQRMPRLPLLRFDLVKCPLPSSSVDGIVLLNVLEHIEDDRAAVAQVARVLRPGGAAVVEVPAGPELYDPYDRYLQHFRRYRLDGVKDLLRAAGLIIREASHLGFLVYPMFALVKRRNRRSLDAPAEVQRAMVERAITSSATGPFLRWAMALESGLDRLVSYPVGIRCVVVATKSR